MPPVKNRRIWILAALFRATGRSLTPVQLQKVLFLLGMKRKKGVGPGYYRFKAYDYGPFTPEIYSDIELLISEQLVRVESFGGRSTRTFALTDEGVVAASATADGLSAIGLAYLDEVVPWAQKLSFADLVSAVYEEFPDMRANSVFRDPA